MNSKRYVTGLASCGDCTFSPPPPYKGRGWVARWEKQRKKIPPVAGKEVILYAANWKTAQRAVDLIVQAIFLYQGSLPLLPETRLIARNETEPLAETPWEKKFLKVYLKTNYLGIGDVDVGCAIASKASRMSKYCYAIEKFSFSCNTFSVAGVDLDPYSSPHLPLSCFLSDHVRFSYAIIAAYSAIEDLGLEIRSTNDKPSKLSDGKWNPEVLADLESRLKKAHVDLGETFLWTLRGPLKKHERRKQLYLPVKAGWSHGGVRDSEVAVVDAIAHASYLRSKVAAHKSNSLTKSLSPYDVISVQQLARRLILSSLGFWRFYERTGARP